VLASVQNSVYYAAKRKEHGMSVTTVPVTEAKQRFTELVKGVEDCFDRYVVTKNGKEAAVVMSASEYESLLETIDILGNKKEVRAIATGSRQAGEKATISLDGYLKQKAARKRRNAR
jgi:antitoxin YefM